MKNIIFLISIVILLKPAFPVLDYVINYDYISKVLCINKEHPQMHCNGKCHLMNELAKNADIEKPATPEKKTTPNDMEVSFCEPLHHFNFPVRINRLYAIANTLYPSLKPSSFHTLLLKPPIALS